MEQHLLLLVYCCIAYASLTWLHLRVSSVDGDISALIPEEPAIAAACAPASLDSTSERIPKEPALASSKREDKSERNETV